MESRKIAQEGDIFVQGSNKTIRIIEMLEIEVGFKIDPEKTLSTGNPQSMIVLKV